MANKELQAAIDEAWAGIGAHHLTWDERRLNLAKMIELHAEHDDATLPTGYPYTAGQFATQLSAFGRSWPYGSETAQDLPEAEAVRFERDPPLTEAEKTHAQRPSTVKEYALAIVDGYTYTAQRDEDSAAVVFLMESEDGSVGGGCAEDNLPALAVTEAITRGLLRPMAAEGHASDAMRALRYEAPTGVEYAFLGWSDGKLWAYGRLFVDDVAEGQLMSCATTLPLPEACAFTWVKEEVTPSVPKPILVRLDGDDLFDDHGDHPDAPGNESKPPAEVAQTAYPHGTGSPAPVGNACGPEDTSASTTEEPSTDSTPRANPGVVDPGNTPNSGPERTGNGAEGTL